MDLKTYMAVAELAQAAAHAYGLTGPVQFTVCGPRNYQHPDLPNLDLSPAIEQPSAIDGTDDFFYAQNFAYTTNYE